MSVNSVMTALADAVRAKSGQTGALTLEQMTEGLNTIPTETTKTITPSASSQVAVENGTYVTGDIVVAGDENLLPNNIISGVSIFGVQGTYDSKESPEVPTESVMALIEGSDIVSILYQTSTNSNFTIKEGDPMMNTLTTTVDSYIILIYHNFSDGIRNIEAEGATVYYNGVCAYNSSNQYMAILKIDGMSVNIVLEDGDL